jgi:hypothetical protein
MDFSDLIYYQFTQCYNIDSKYLKQRAFILETVI